MKEIQIKYHQQIIKITMKTIRNNLKIISNKKLALQINKKRHKIFNLLNIKSIKVIQI